MRLLNFEIGQKMLKANYCLIQANPRGLGFSDTENSILAINWLQAPPHSSYQGVEVKIFQNTRNLNFA